jgi:hypothetical protein
LCAPAPGVLANCSKGALREGFRAGSVRSLSLGACIVGGKLAETGGAVTVLASDQNGPWAIAVDASSVYWAAGADDPGGYDAANAPRLGGVIRKLTPK